MRLYDFQEYQRFRKIAREFGWTMREYKEVVRAVDSLFDDLEFQSEEESPGPDTLAGPVTREEPEREDPAEDSASASP